MSRHGPRDTAAIMASRPWLTPAGCEATGGHRPDGDGVCRICGQTPETPS